MPEAAAALLALACSLPAPAEPLVFPRPDVPETALVVYESTRPESPDRSEGWRFRLDADGCYYLARNQGPLFVDTSALADEDPARFWNTPLPTTPRACLDAAALARVRAAFDAVDLPADGPSPVPEPAQDAATVRWTLRRDDGLHAVILPDPEAWRHAGALARGQGWVRLRADLAAAHDQLRREVEAALRR